MKSYEPKKELTKEEKNNLKVMESINRVYSIKFFRDLLIRESTVKAKFWTLGFITSGIKTIIFMATLSLYTLLFA